MRPRTSVPAAACVLFVSLALPLGASAQRAAVRVVRRPVVVRSYYRPLFYDPWYFGVGYPWYPYPGFYYGYQRPYYDLSGSLRLQVSPRDTEVFIDGYFAGTVDDFDGIFQRLHVEPGEHDLELYMPGYRSVQQKIYLQPGKTTRLRLDMEPLAPGDPVPARPAGSAAPVRRDGGQDGVRVVPRDRGARDVPPPGDAIADPGASYGRLSIRIQPEDAAVLIDGERWEGPSADERLVVELAAGRHVIEIEKDGYRRYTSEVNVERGETTTLNVALTAQ